MAIAHSTSLMVLSLTTQLFFFLLTPQLIKAQSSSAPAPSPSGPINITAILEKGGQYTTFIRLLVKTQAGNQINNQLNSSTDGMTVFAPTDNAFTNLPAGTLNKLNDQQQVQLIQYHILPKYYSLQNLETVSNPVRTQASGQNGEVFGLNFTGQGNQVNVSTGVVETQVNNALRSNFPLAVYQVDKVLLPAEFTRAKPPAPATPPGNGKSPSGSAPKKKPTEDGPASDSPPSDSGRINVRSGMVVGIGLFCLRLLF